MKRIIITVLSVLILIGLVSWKLTSNKNENEAKAAVVSQVGNVVAVKTSSVTQRPINLDFKSNGTFSANQELQLQSEASGRITNINVDKGTVVTKGQVLAVIESEVATLEVTRAEENYQKLLTDFQRYQSSFKTGGVTQAQMDEIELGIQNAKIQLQQAKKRLGDATIKSPMDGIINDRLIEVGSFVGPGTPLFEIVDDSYLKLNVSANEYQVVNISKGDSVEIYSKVFPGEIFKGAVNFIAVKADGTLNYPIEILVKNQNNIPLKSGMYATAQFKFSEGSSNIVIERAAFVGGVNSNKIYVYNQKDETASLREIVSGRVLGDYVEVISGLEEGEAVITSGQINLKDGAKVEILN